MARIVVGERVSRRGRLPDFMIAGVAKAGTTSLVRYLSQHPDLCFADNKEPYFFSFGEEIQQASDAAFRRLIVRDEKSYRELFSQCGEGQLCGEASTSYLYTYRTTIPRIREVYATAGVRPPKLVAVLRNPVDRAFSHFMYLKLTGVERLSFEEAIEKRTVAHRSEQRYWDFDYLNYGLYYQQVKAYLAAFPEMRLYLFEDLASSPLTVVQDIFCYLGVEVRAVDTSFRANPSGVPRSETLVKLLIGDGLLKKSVKKVCPARWRTSARRFRDGVLARFLRSAQLEASTRGRLVAFYREDVKKLEELIGRDLSSWLEASSPENPRAEGRH